MPRMTSVRLRGRTPRVLLAAAVATCALPAAAQAASVELGADDKLKVSDPEGRQNNLAVFAEGSSVEIRDLGGMTSRTPFCAQASTIRVRCAIGFQLDRVDLGEGNDNVSIGVTNQVLVLGGSGSDAYTGARAQGTSRVSFRGGTGTDTVTYQPADRGVRIRTDDFFGDGRIGLDQDDIGSDVERLVGSPFADEITDAVRTGLQTIAGGPGDDVLRGAIQSDSITTFDMGGVADGADKIIGEAGTAFLDYHRRTQPVTVTNQFGLDDDGQAGERDDVQLGRAHITGGQAGDTLRAFPTADVGFGFSGGPGNDKIDGGNGGDNIDAGPGTDTVSAGGGNDFVNAVDSEFDVIGCGLGTDDTASLDSADVQAGCETRRIGVLRLAPKTQKADAGKPVVLRLTWRHPRAWKQLDRVTLRLTQDGMPVGEVTIRPRRERVRASGAVRLSRTRTQLTHRGKAVSARLAVRLPRALAGRTLRADVEAVDVHGARQIERDAATIRVAG